MSWARYWATRASDALNARGATPLAARSWLTRLIWRPAAPPTPETGGGGGAGWKTGAGCTATGAATGAAGAGAGVGGGVTRRASWPRRFTPACSAPWETIRWLTASGPDARGCAGRLPRILMVASATSGAPRIRTTLVTERDNSNSPLWSSLGDFRGRRGIEIGRAHV